MGLPFAIGSITIRQSDPSVPPGSPHVPVEVRCSVCGAVSGATANVWDEDYLIYLANQLSKHLCPANGHGAYEI